MKYIKCQKCGWIHFIEPDFDTPRICFNCGNTDTKMLVKALKKEVPIGSTIQPINRPSLPSHADLRKKVKPMKDDSAKLIRRERDER